MTFVTDTPTDEPPLVSPTRKLKSEAAAKNRVVVTSPCFDVENSTAKAPVTSTKFSTAKVAVPDTCATSAAESKAILIVLSSGNVIASSTSVPIRFIRSDKSPLNSSPVTPTSSAVPLATTAKSISDAPLAFTAIKPKSTFDNPTPVAVG